MTKSKVRNLALTGLLSAALAVPAMAQQSNQNQYPDRNQNQNQTYQNQNQTQNQSNRQLTSQEKTFLNNAAMDNMLEIQAGQMAQQKSQNSQVQQYGQTLANDHQSNQQQLKDLAQQYNYTLPNNLDQQHQQEMNRLQNLSGAQFDRQFLQSQVNDHQKAVQKFQNTAQNAQDQNIRQFASQTVPVLQKHLNEAQRLQQTVQTSSNMQSNRQGRNQSAQAGAINNDNTQAQNDQTGAVDRDQQAQTSNQAGASTQAMNRGANQNAPGALPATASNEQILVLIGLLSIAGATTLRLCRNRA